MEIVLLGVLQNNSKNFYQDNKCLQNELMRKNVQLTVNARRYKSNLDAELATEDCAAKSVYQVLHIKNFIMHLCHLKVCK